MPYISFRRCISARDKACFESLVGNQLEVTISFIYRTNICGVFTQLAFCVRFLVCIDDWLYCHLPNLRYHMCNCQFMVGTDHC